MSTRAEVEQAIVVLERAIAMLDQSIEILGIVSPRLGIPKPTESDQAMETIRNAMDIVHWAALDGCVDTVRQPRKTPQQMRDEVDLAKLFPIAGGPVKRKRKQRRRHS